MILNPLKLIAYNWYGYLTPRRAAKMDRLWRNFLRACRTAPKPPRESSKT